jgi:hypothetical protein
VAALPPPRGAGECHSSASRASPGAPPPARVPAQVVLTRSAPKHTLSPPPSPTLPPCIPRWSCFKSPSHPHRGCRLPEALPPLPQSTALPKGKQAPSQPSAPPSSSCLGGPTTNCRPLSHRGCWLPEAPRQRAPAGVAHQRHIRHSGLCADSLLGSGARAWAEGKGLRRWGAGGEMLDIHDVLCGWGWAAGQEDDRLRNAFAELLILVSHPRE